MGMYESYSELMTYMGANNITLEAYSPLQVLMEGGADGGWW